MAFLPRRILAIALRILLLTHTLSSSRGSARLSSSRRLQLFRNARVAILLTGEAFRTSKQRSTDHSHSCANASFEAQRSASHSLIGHVIVPIETLGAHVEVLFTFPSCGRDAPGGAWLLESLRSWYGNRVVAHRVVGPTRHVGHSWQLAFMLLRDHIRAIRGNSTGSSIRSNSGQTSLHDYDFVFSVRHDLEMLRPVTSWPGDLSQQLVLGVRGTVKVDCEWGDQTQCKAKANDKMLWTPRRQLAHTLRVLAHDNERDDDDFNPHYFVEHLATVPPGALSRRYQGHGLTNQSCAGDGQQMVPPHLRLSFAPGVSLLRLCDWDEPLFRFAPDRATKKNAAMSARLRARR